MVSTVASQQAGPGTVVLQNEKEIIKCIGLSLFKK